LRSRINKEYVKKSEGVVEVFLELGEGGLVEGRITITE